MKKIFKSQVKKLLNIMPSQFISRLEFSRQSFERFNERPVEYSYVFKWLQQNDGKIVDQEYWQFWEGNFWTMGNQLIPPIRVSAEDRHQLTCVLIQNISR